MRHGRVCRRAGRHAEAPAAAGVINIQSGYYLPLRERILFTPMNEQG